MEWLLAVLWLFLTPRPTLKVDFSISLWEINDATIFSIAKAPTARFYGRKKRGGGCVMAFWGDEQITWLTSTVIMSSTTSPALRCFGGTRGGKYAARPLSWRKQSHKMTWEVYNLTSNDTNIAMYDTNRKFNKTNKLTLWFYIWHLPVKCRVRRR